MPGVSVQGRAEPLSAAGRRVAIESWRARCRGAGFPPFTARARAQAGLALGTRTRAIAAPFATRAIRALAFMQERPVLRRSSPLHLLDEASRTAWLRRLANTKRVAWGGLDLLGLFERVSIEPEGAIRFVAQSQAIAYRLPAKPLPLATIVIARHRGNGHILVGRFESG